MLCERVDESVRIIHCGKERGSYMLYISPTLTASAFFKTELGTARGSARISSRFVGELLRRNARPTDFVAMCSCMAAAVCCTLVCENRRASSCRTRVSKERIVNSVMQQRGWKWRAFRSDLDAAVGGAVEMW